MTVEHSKEANLWPFDVEMSLALGLQNIEDDGHSVFIIFADDTLICICCVRFNKATFLLTGFRRLVVLQQDSLRIQWRRVLAKEECLNLDELDVRFFVTVVAVGLRRHLSSRLMDLRRIHLSLGLVSRGCCGI